MDILEPAKRKIANFQAVRKRQPLIIEESAGPFRYEYVSVNHVVGAKLPDGSPDPLQIAHFPDMNATVCLTHDWDKPYFHIDRANAVATLLLTGLVGIKRFKKLSRSVDRFLQWIFGREWVFMRNLEAQAKKIREQRLKDHSGSGCCLVYRAGGQVDQPLNLRASRRFAEVGVALDAFDGSMVREAHKLNLRSVATAVSIVTKDTNGSPEIRFLADNVHLLSKDELVIYVRTLKMGAAGLVVTTIPSDEFVAAVETYTAGLSADSKLASAASLFALSQHKSNDNLRSFIASWSALELLIFNLEKKYRDAFKALLLSEDVSLPVWDKDLSVTDIKEYRLRDRFYAVTCSINLAEAAADTGKFNELNSKRNDYYHRFQIADTELPTFDVQALFRKYLKIVLSKL
jgi:hypothetical protein